VAGFAHDEIEAAFRTYWRTGAVAEDWEAWCDLFTEDCLYVEHSYGTMLGREAVRRWIVPLMERYGEIYTVYEWHVIDAERGRVVVYMRNRRDDPGGEGAFDFPGVTILEYAGGGRWKRAEDFYSATERDAAMRAYAERCRLYDPGHPGKRTRANWGDGPASTRGGPSWAERPRLDRGRG
jgi:ketosteroid isomerase-like protein